MSISQLLNITRPLVVLDTETTGLDVNVARVIELGFQMHYPEIYSKPLLEYRTLINPGIPIPPESIEVHHITDAMVQGCRECGQSRSDGNCQFSIQGLSQPWPGEHPFKPWPAFKDLAANLQKGFTNCDFAGKRVTYDLQILSAEFARAGVPWTIGDARIVDADRLEALLNPRHLSDLYKKYTGEDMKDAHSALADVQGTTTVLEKQLDGPRCVYLNVVQLAQVMNALEGWDGKDTAADEARRKSAFELIQEACEPVTQLPRDLDELHALQFHGMIDLAGKFVFLKGVPCFGRWGKFQGRPMRDADSGYWDFILKSDFSTEVKKLAAEAKLGRFPEKK